MLINNIVRIDMIERLKECSHMSTNLSTHSSVYEHSSHKINEKVLEEVGSPESNTILHPSFNEPRGTKKMTAKYRFTDDKDTSFDGDKDYTYCQQCEWNGIPNQKIVIVYLGIRPINEPGFIYKFETYDYSENVDKKIHQHKYDPEMVDRLVDAALNRKM